MIAIPRVRPPAWLCLVLLATSASVPAQDPARVRVATPEVARHGERFALTGTLTAERAAELSPRVDGLVAKVRVDAGDRVDAGEVLVDLDAELARHALARIRAERERAQAARQEAQRLLAEARRVGEQDFIPATLVATRESELQLAQAGLAAARAAEREQAELVARHALTAPFAGVIAAKRTEAGEWVQRGTPVLSLVATDRVRLDLRVPQERYDELGEDIRATVYPDALGGVGLPARFGAKVPVTDPGARTFLLRLLVEDGSQRLLPGTSARAEIALPAAEAALTISRDALLRQPDGGYSLFVVAAGQGGDVARQRTVRVLREQDGRVAIAEGLSAGERVVVRGNEALRDGQRVQVVED